MVVKSYFSLDGKFDFSRIIESVHSQKRIRNRFSQQSGGIIQLDIQRLSPIEYISL
ncbi:MAG: hypothetical protein Kow0090_00710 [Myxococcota bacterium]